MSDQTLPPSRFSTGLSPLADVGQLFYNNVIFGPLLESHVSAVAEQDNAGRTTKWIKLTIEVDGYVTLNAGQTTTDTNMFFLRQQLSQDAGVLIYKGRGFGSLTVNQFAGGAGASVGNYRDLNWGPKPEIIEFQPLGAGRGAKVKWRVTTWISELPPLRNHNVIQFSELTVLNYDDEGYSSLSIRGILEIGMTRTASNSRRVLFTADTQRQNWLDRIADSFDLTRYRVTRRSFEVSADKRVMNWEFTAEEFGPMPLPAGATAAHGSFRFQPMKKGAGLMAWLCSLRGTYTIRHDWPRRTAWMHFATLLAFRMQQTELLPLPGLLDVAAQLQNTPPGIITQRRRNLLQLRTLQQQHAQKAILISITGDEGLYLDSKTVTFEAQFTLIQPLANILIATGFHRFVTQDIDPATFGGPPAPLQILREGDGANFWATRMRDIQGWRSWMFGSIDANQDVIVDFGGGGPTAPIAPGA